MPSNGVVIVEKSSKRQPCKFKKGNVGATAKGLVKLKKGCEKQLKVAVATVGPISVFIDPHFRPFRFYKHGIVDDPSCTTYRLNHVVLSVGYGVQNGIEYWLLKNSYGDRWGDGGYFKVIRNKNMCGVAASPSYPLV
ncbi:cathepsin L-like [Dermacentor silvarum]|uniref:cathepsin L-like n=1 Tax=Dermacentor silvarum TaxID=543639 RepID=UPI0021016403|nr:cathepsin L-like [Dermacentor silvarum]